MNLKVNWTAADVAVFDIRLLPNSTVNGNLYLLPAVGTVNKFVFLRVHGCSSLRGMSRLK